MDDPVSAWLRAMPKAELHLHLDGSLRPRTALELARERGLPGAGELDLDRIRDRLVAPPRCTDQAELLAAFELPVSLLQDRAALTRAAGELVEDVAGDGTRYAEVRWAPTLHLEGGLTVRDVLETVVEASARAAVRQGIHVRLIAVAMRTQPPNVAEELAREAQAFRDAGLTGFDLAGREQEAPDVTGFTGAFELARAAGLGLTCHAGEWGGAAQVRAALALTPWRIAHGAPAAKDEALMGDLIEAGVTLDLCPTSNVQAGVASWGPGAPLPRLVRAGVPVTISTDDRTVSDLTLVRELRRAMDLLGLVAAEIVAVVRQAYAAAFLHHDEALRAELLATFDAWVAAHPPPFPGTR
ncbi:adenosine deaminase [soil metagenome]